MKKLKLQLEAREWGLCRRPPALAGPQHKWGLGCSQRGKLRFAPVMGTSLLGDPVKAKGKVRQTLQLLGTWENCLRAPRKQEPLLPDTTGESYTARACFCRTAGKILP